MNNYCLRRLRYALNLNDKAVLAVFSEMNYRLTVSELKGFLVKETEPGFVELPDYLLVIFLDGLIQQRRGKRDDAVVLSQSERIAESKRQRLNNNVIVNKIKIAFNLKADELIAVLELADFRISKPEMTAFFRKPEHRNYRECGNQLLRNLLTGLTIHLAKTKPSKTDK